MVVGTGSCNFCTPISKLLGQSNCDLVHKEDQLTSRKRNTAFLLYCFFHFPVFYVFAPLWCPLRWQNTEYKTTTVVPVDETVEFERSVEGCVLGKSFRCSFRKPCHPIGGIKKLSKSTPLNKWSIRICSCFCNVSLKSAAMM